MIKIAKEILELCYQVSLYVSKLQHMNYYLRIT